MAQITKLSQKTCHRRCGG